MKRADGKFLTNTCTLLLLGHAVTALAHTQAGSLGAPESATDYYQATCTDDGSGPPASLVTQVEGNTAGQTVSVLLNKGDLARNSTDTVGANGAASPLASVNGGAGVYNVYVRKTTAGEASYTLTFHCMTGPDGTGIHTGSDVTVRQSQ